MIKLINLENGIKVTASVAKLFLCYFILLSSQSFANKGKDPNRYPQIMVNNAEIEFGQGRGLALVQKAQYEIHPVMIKNDNLKLGLELIGKKMNLKEQKIEVLLGFDFSFLKDFHHIDLNLQQMSVKNQDILLDIPSLDLHLSGQEFEFDKIKLASQIPDISKKADLKNNLIVNTELSISKFEFGKVKFSDYEQDMREENVEEEAHKEIDLLIQDNLTAGLIKYIHKIKLTIKNGSLRLTGKIKTPINFGVLLTGKIKNDENAKKIEMKVSKMKVGVVNVRRAVLKYLRDLKITNLTINPKSGHIVYAYE